MAPTRPLTYRSYSFRMLLEILKLYEQEHPPPAGTTNYYFLDQFSLNQHTFVDDKEVAKMHPHAEKASVEPQDESEKEKKEMQQQIVVALRTQMLKAGHVLMCLWPLEAPTPLKRAWCLFELWIALQHGVKLTMCFCFSRHTIRKNARHPCHTCMQL